jgi:histone arginine demethylase JMJD6
MANVITGRIFNPDYDKFHLFKNAKGITVTVEQGDTILFSKGWWHTTEMDGPSISLGRIQLNASNWNEFLKDNNTEWKRRNKSFRSVAYLYGYGLSY